MYSLLFVGELLNLTHKSVTAGVYLIPCAGRHLTKQFKGAIVKYNKKRSHTFIRDDLLFLLKISHNYQF
jgi:hypothetical protein